MRRFVQSLYQSLYNPAWLKAQRFTPSNAWTYFALIVVLFAFAVTVPVAITVPAVVREFRTFVTSKIPDFTATMKKGKLSIAGIEQPFVYRSDDGTGLLYIDTVTTSSLSAADFATSSATGVVLITADDFSFYNATDGSSRSTAFKNTGDGTLTKADVVNGIAKFTGTPTQIIFDFIILVGMYIGMFVSKLMVILCASLITLIIARVRNVQWSFGEVFTIGLYAITLPSIISLVASLLGFSMGAIQFLALLAFMIAIVWSGEEVKQK